MTDLEILTEAYRKTGILFVIRDRLRKADGPLWQYLFLVGDKSREEVETGDLDYLLRNRSFIEFMDGKVASY